MKVWTGEADVNMAWNKKPKRNTTPGLQFLRAWRVFELAALLLNLAIGVANAANGHLYALLSFGIVAALAGLLMWQQGVIRKRMAQLNPPPRPDYGRIASLERPIWGQAFEHAGAPEMGRFPIPERSRCRGCGSPDSRRSGRCTDCYRKWRRNLQDKQIEGLVRAGKQPAEIADLLGVTPQTIRSIMQNKL